MNICFLLGRLTGNSGIGRVTSILANNFSVNGEYQIYTLSYYNNHKINFYYLNENIINGYLFDNPISMTNGILKGGIFKLKKYLKQNQIDVLIACGALYYPISILSCMGTRTKCICWEHSNVENGKDYAFQTCSRKFASKHADLLVTLTKQDQNSYIDKYKIKNITQIYNPIDDKIFEFSSKYKEESMKLLSVGRLTYPKNFSMLIDIAKIVLENNSGWTWDIYGDGELREELQLKIKRYGLENRLFLKGQVKDLYNVYNDYSMLIMTSLSEGFPMVLLEGMANGLPLISFDIKTGPNEIIEDEINGYLIKAFNLEEMALKIDYLINNPQKRLIMSEYGKKNCERFKLSEIVMQWEEIINALYEEV